MCQKGEGSGGEWRGPQKKKEKKRKKEWIKEEGKSDNS
jgi:hypothetical protein